MLCNILSLFLVICLWPFIMMQNSPTKPTVPSTQGCRSAEKIDCIRNDTSCHKYVRQYVGENCTTQIKQMDCNHSESNCIENGTSNCFQLNSDVEKTRRSCFQIFENQKAKFCNTICSNRNVVVTDTIFTSQQINCLNYSEFRHLISSTCPEKSCANDCRLEHVQSQTQIITSIMKSKHHQCKPTKKILLLTKVLNYSVEGQDMIADECPNNVDYIRSRLIHEGECFPEVETMRQRRSPCKVWSTWSQCSVSCNVGSRTRSKETPFNGGCTKMDDTEHCMMNVCSKSITGNLCVFLKYNTSNDIGNIIMKRIKIGGSHSCTVEPADRGFTNNIYPLKNIPMQVIRVKLDKEPEITIILTTWPLMVLNGVLIITIVLIIMLARHFRSTNLVVDTEDDELIEENESPEEIEQTMESNSPPINVDTESKTILTITVKESDGSNTMERVTSPPILSDPFKTESVTTLDLDTLVTSKAESSAINAKVTKENGKSVLTSKKKTHAYPSITKKSTGAETSWIKVQLSDGKSIEEPSSGNHYIKVADIPNVKTKVLKSKSGSE